MICNGKMRGFGLMSKYSTYRLTEFDNNYSLQVPFSEKERAKSIVGYKWNPVMKSWDYPKTEQVLLAITNLFGEYLRIRYRGLNSRKISYTPSSCYINIPGEEKVIREGDIYSWKGIRMRIIRNYQSGCSMNYSVELLEGCWPDDLDLLTICDNSTPTHVSHFGGWISELDKNKREVDVDID